MRIPLPILLNKRLTYSTSKVNREKGVLPSALINREHIRLDRHNDSWVYLDLTFISFKVINYRPRQQEVIMAKGLLRFQSPLFSRMGLKDLGRALLGHGLWSARPWGMPYHRPEHPGPAQPMPGMGWAVAHWLACRAWPPSPFYIPKHETDP